MRKEGKGIKINWRVLITCIIVVALVELAGSWFTSKSVNSSWYNSIAPSITPPGWVFPIVWNVLFLLIAISLYFTWQASKGRMKKKRTFLVYGTNFYLNVIWRDRKSVV